MKKTKKTIAAVALSLALLGGVGAGTFALWTQTVSTDAVTFTPGKMTLTKGTREISEITSGTAVPFSSKEAAEAYVVVPGESFRIVVPMTVEIKGGSVVADLKLLNGTSEWNPSAATGWNLTKGDLYTDETGTSKWPDGNRTAGYVFKGNNNETVTTTVYAVIDLAFASDGTDGVAQTIPALTATLTQRTPTN